MLRTFACVAALAAAIAHAGDGPGVGPRLEGPLARIVSTSKPGRLIPVIIRMRRHASAQQVSDAVEGLDRHAARQAVIDLLKPMAQATQADLLEYLEARLHENTAADVRPLWIANVIGARLTPDVIRAVGARPDVEYVNYDPPVGTEVLPVLPPSDGGVAGIECGVELMGAPKCWDEGITGRGVVCAIIDTGCCIAHPDLKNQIWQNPGEIPGNGIDDDGNGFKDDVHGWNFENNSNILTDLVGHGTHTTGTVAGDGTNGTRTGMAPDVRMMICKFLNNVNSGQPSVWASMQYATENRADIITASIGWFHQLNPDRKTWREVSENCMKAGVAVTFAAGNGGACGTVDCVATPGDVPDMISVGATGCDDRIAAFSSRGPVTWQNVPPFNDWPHPPGKIKPEVCGPGVNTISTSNNCTGYATASGTSMATPHVAGALALMYQVNRNLTHLQALDILKKTAVDLGEPGEENTHGSGRVDAYAAVKMAQSLSCKPDLNSDGMLDIDDFIEFQRLFGGEDSRADFNGDQTWDIDDFIDFQTAFAVGCAP